MIQPNFIYNGTIVRIIDGDTYEIAVDLGFDVTITKNIRLLDVDTPETWRPKTEAERAHGTQATEFVKSKFGPGDKVVLESVKFGKYRYCATVYFVENEQQYSIAQLLIENNLEKRTDYE